MLGYLSTDIICSEKRTIFRECSLRKTVSSEEQIMSKDKYPSIFSPQRETNVFIMPFKSFTQRGVYLTIIPRARMGYESIDHEAEGQMVY